MMNKFVKSILIMIIICFQYSFSQSVHYISGTVVDKNGEPLLGANINLKGTFLGSTTDVNGYYRIENVDPGKYVLMVSYIGYKSQEIDLYISVFESSVDEENQESSFASKLGLDEDEETLDQTDRHYQGSISRKY